MFYSEYPRTRLACSRFPALFAAAKKKKIRKCKLTETMTRDINGLRNIGDKPESYRKQFVFIALFVLNSLSLGVPV